MAKQRPTLGVTAAPVSTYVAPLAAAAELYDQQAVALALDFSEAFQNLTVSAARLAGKLKAEQNQEDVARGADLINQSQRSYQQLVESGEIKPSENPWMAIGAQQASGAVEGMKARAHFLSLYEKKKKEDPRFLDGSEGFNTLASQYVENVNANMKDAAYQSRAFFESFNPFITGMASKHEANVVEHREKRILIGVGAAVAQVTQDYASSDPIVKATAVETFQSKIDEYARMGMNPTQINQAVVDNMVAVMKDTDNIEVIEELLGQLSSGTGLLKDTEYAKTALNFARPAIEQNRQKLTIAKDSRWREFVSQNADSLSSLSDNDMIKSLEMAMPEVVGPISPEQARSMLSYGRSEIKQRRNDREEERNRQIRDISSESIRRIMQSEIPEGEDPETFVQDLIKNESMVARLVMPKGADLNNQLTSLERLGASRLDDIRKQKAQAITDELYRYRQAVIDGDQIPETAATKMRELMGSAGYTEKEKQDFLFAFDKEYRETQDDRATTQVLREIEALQQVQRQSLVAETMSFIGINDDGTMSEGTEFMPDIRSRRRETENYFVRRGLSDTDMKRALQMDGNKMEQALDDLEDNLTEGRTGSTLAPLENDSISERQIKAQLRQRLLGVRMQVAQVYETGSLAKDMETRVFAALNPQVAEAGGSWGLEDAFLAFDMVEQSGLDPSTILPSGDRGKAMAEIMVYGANRLRSGMPASEIAKDVATLQVTSVRGGISLKDILNDPLALLSIRSGNTKEVKEVQETFQGVRKNLGVENPDALPYATSEFRRHYMDALTRTSRHDKALTEVVGKMRSDYVSFRGSMIPTKALPSNMTKDSAANDLGELLDLRYPGQNATLVVLYETTEGIPMMAVRNADGLSVPGANSLLTPADLQKREADVIKAGMVEKQRSMLKTSRRLRELNM